MPSVKSKLKLFFKINLTIPSAVRLVSLICHKNLQFGNIFNPFLIIISSYLVSQAVGSSLEFMALIASKASEYYSILVQPLASAISVAYSTALIYTSLVDLLLVIFAEENISHPLSSRTTIPTTVLPIL